MFTGKKEEKHKIHEGKTSELLRKEDLMTRFSERSLLCRLMAPPRLFTFSSNIEKKYSLIIITTREDCTWIKLWRRISWISIKKSFSICQYSIIIFSIRKSRFWNLWPKKEYMHINEGMEFVRKLKMQNFHLKFGCRFSVCMHVAMYCY